MAPQKRFLLTALLFLLPTIAFQTASAVPDRPAPGDSATTQVQVIVPAGVDTFRNHQLEVMLYEFDPRVKDNETRIDLQINKAFSHNRGTELSVPITLGTNTSLKPGMQYYVTVNVLNAAGKRTHLGEKDGKRGIDRSNQFAIIVRPARPRDVVIDIAEEIKKGNNVKAGKIALAGAKEFEEIFDVMDLHRMRRNGAMGWGPTPANNPNQDSIQHMLRTLERGVPANFLQDAKNNEEAALWIAAMAELTAAKPDFRPVGNKTNADWRAKAGQLRKEADAFGQAIAAKNVVAIRNGAQAITNACNQCHSVYRD